MSPPSGIPLSADAGAAAQARAFVESEAAAVDGDRRYQLALIASELVTNAVRHGGAPIRFEFTVTRAVARGAVHDCGTAFDVDATLPAAEAFGGRGLFIVQSMATRWGVTPAAAGPGKSVWFELSLD